MIFKENILNYDIYNSLRKSVAWNAYTEEQARQALENTYYSLVAYADDKAVGMSRVISDGIYFLIVDVVVMPEYQGQGIGTEMMQQLIEYIDKKTPVGSRSSIQLLSIAGKESFYEKQGFKKLPNEYCGCGMRMIIHKENM